MHTLWTPAAYISGCRFTKVARTEFRAWMGNRGVRCASLGSLQGERWVDRLRFQIDLSDAVHFLSLLIC